MINAVICNLKAPEATEPDTKLFMFDGESSLVLDPKTITGMSEEYDELSGQELWFVHVEALKHESKEDICKITNKQKAVVKEVGGSAVSLYETLLRGDFEYIIMDSAEKIECLCDDQICLN